MLKNKPPLLYSFYNWLLTRMGEKRYYPEVQRIEKQIAIKNSETQYPSTNVIVKGLFSLLVVVVNRIFDKLFWAEQWFLLIDFDHISEKSYKAYKKIMPPKDRYWADPHIIQMDNTYYLFVEEYFYKKKKGSIAVIQVNKSGEYKDSVQIIDKDYHLSYPFVFKNNDDYYLIPESSENRTIQLYKCVNFPYLWEFQMNIMTDVVAVDTTLVYYSNLFWLFTVMSGSGESLPKGNLYLYYSENLFSNDWKPHPQNPIISDYVSARSAGRIFEENGKLYRPSQDASINYGRGVFINEIIRLSADEYKEKKVSSICINLEKNVHGPHTYTRDGSITVIDVYRKLLRHIM
jgi:hypothetical protein